MAKAGKPKPAEKKTGRPSNLTPEVQQALVEAIGRSFYIETACAIVGIARPTFYSWMKRGKREKGGPYGEFRDTVKKALAEKEARCVEGIMAAASESWQAFAWLLERRYPERWASNRKDIADLKRQLDRVEANIAQRGNSPEEAACPNGASNAAP